MPATPTASSYSSTPLSEFHQSSKRVRTQSPAPPNIFIDLTADEIETAESLGSASLECEPTNDATTQTATPEQKAIARCMKKDWLDDLAVYAGLDLLCDGQTQCLRKSQKNGTVGLDKGELRTLDLPQCFDGHWTLTILNVETRKLVCTDSLNGSTPTGARAEELLKTVNGFLPDYNLSLEEVTSTTKLTSARQSGGHYGIFVVANGIYCMLRRQCPERVNTTIWRYTTLP